MLLLLNMEVVVAAVLVLPVEMEHPQMVALAELGLQTILQVHQFITLAVAVVQQNLLIVLLVLVEMVAVVLVAVVQLLELMQL